MNLSALKSFAPEVRLQLIDAVGRKLDYVLTADTADLRSKQSQRDSLREQAEIDRSGLVEKVAYTWFNRLAALRFLDAEGRHPFQARVITAATTDETQPEVLRLMRMGSLPAELGDFTDLARLNDLLDGRLPTATAGADPQGEVYRHLILAACRFYHAAMPFVFEAINDETELLLPDDLLTPTSVAEPFRSKINDEDCQDVEIIGWLYQFYISEKKDEVFAGLKKNKKITPDNIPAATQLFTPNWIVRYLVENSLGRLWMLNRPNSRLSEKMNYYIKPEQEDSDFLRISSPEEIKVCDPACGSGHMLVYAFDLLYIIYEEEGYEPTSIPEKILKNNLFGVDIDERAGSLAAFALAMKARAKSRRFFRKPVQPNICVLQSIKFEEGELKGYMDFIGRDLFTAPLINTLHQFEESDNFGSLIRPDVTNVGEILDILNSKKVTGDSSLKPCYEKVRQALQQADSLSSKYHVILANPPYMGVKGVNSRLGAWSKKQYPQSKSDLFAMFIERCLELITNQGLVAMVTMQSWMFLSSFEKMRERILEISRITSLVQIGYNSFPELNSKVVQAVAFVLSADKSETLGYFINVNDAPQSADKHKEYLKRLKDKCVYRKGAGDFRKIPGSPIVYWASPQIFDAFEKLKPLSHYASARQGLATSDNNRFVRSWSEVSFSNIGFNVADKVEAVNSQKRWFPFSKGGNYRKWYGNYELVVDWENDGERIKQSITTKYPYLNGNPDFVAKNPGYYFRPGLTWSALTSGNFSIRKHVKGAIFADKGQTMFPVDQSNEYALAGLFNSKIGTLILKMLSPTLNFDVGYVSKVPTIINNNPQVEKMIEIAKKDWDFFETSWGFKHFPLLNPELIDKTLKLSYEKLRSSWKKLTLEVKQLEENNNRLFIESYKLNEEISPDISMKEVTLNINPYYRYGDNKSEDALEKQLQSDTAKELVSYAVGCMFGRYSLERTGLILAGQGENLEHYCQKVEKNIDQIRFMPDDDAIIPILDGEWFEDDAVARVRDFLRLTFGGETLEINLRWLEESIGKDLRSYFCANTGGFYDHHIKIYKKRPIYWMFQSPKKHFRALVYLHRYTKDTVNRILDGYLREFMHKQRSRMEHLDHVLASDATPTREATQARREKDQIIAALRDCEEYEREILLPLAQQRIELDLDDGVKVNYNKLGNALAKVTGLSGK